MLVGFLKNPEEKNCNCRIVEYCDRIWIDEKGDASIFRFFIIEVDKKSPQKLSEINMLIPFEHILNLKDRTETYFNPDFHLNDRGKAGRFKIKNMASPLTTTQVTPSGMGVIDDDGFENIKVFEGSSLSVHSIINLNLLNYSFPVPLEPGDLCAARLSFSVTSLFENMSPGNKFPSYEFLSGYFEVTKYEEALKQIDYTVREIPVMSTLGPPLGGFDIMIYFPGNMQIGRCNPSNADISSDKTHFDKIGDTFLTRYLWRARKIYPDQTEMRAGKTHFSLECTNITPQDTIAEDIDDMKQKTKILDDNFIKLAGKVSDFTESFMKSMLGVKKELRAGTAIALLGLVISLIALFISLKDSFFSLF